jgi:internalin A
MPEQQANQPLNFSSFADWCKHKDSLSESARHTVEVLLKQAGTCDCNEANRVLSNLTELHLPSHKITDITPLSGFTNLTRLHLDNNQITDITGLCALINLTSLHLEANSITELTGLCALTNLRRLYLSNNPITDITGLSALTNLTRLFLSNTPVTDITGLSALTNMFILNLHNNQITDITPVSGLTKLTRLIISSNQITDITPLSALTNEPEIYLYNNPITDLNLPSELTQKYLTLKTAPIDSKKATKAVKKIYAAIGVEAPEVIVCSSPQVASLELFKLLNIDSVSRDQIWEIAVTTLVGEKSLLDQIFEELDAGDQISEIAVTNLVWGKSLLHKFFQWLDVGFSGWALWNALSNAIILDPNGDRILVSEFQQLLKNDLKSLGEDFPSYFNDRELEPLTPTTLVKEIHLAEFLNSKFGVTLDLKAQELLRCKQELFEECGWILPFEKICIICDRPLHIRLDAENRLHAEGEPAIAFADGYSLYFHHGVKLPEKYGKVHPDLWQAEWLLSEENAGLRRLLIQRIGYDRICQELALTELDSWQEYTLLSIEFNDDFDREGNAKPIYLLKMTCPSTGFIHALRVPPDVRSAKEAIRWVNWDIDPEEFSVQT